MIRFARVPEPADFDEKARVPGNAWLVANPDKKRPRDFWTPFKGPLADGFRSLCAHSVMYEPNGTVDHFVSWNEGRQQAYEWDNYRFCAGWINSSKTSTPANDLLDPFEVEDGWFEVHLPSLQLRVSESTPKRFGNAPRRYWSSCISVTTNGSCGNAESDTAFINAGSFHWSDLKQRHR